MTDPYSFGPVLGPMDDYYIAEGSHLRLFDKLGAHLIEHEGATGVHFAVWAPNARRVSVVGDFNDWDGRRHPMRNRRDTGIWEIFIPDIGAGRAYKYEIIGPDGARLPLKADPFAFQSELRPATASVAAAPPAHEWGDEAHRAFWRKADHAPRSRSRSMRCMPAPGSARDDGTLPVLGRTGRPADPLCRRHGLHPYRVHADHRASLRSVLGLPDDRPLRADRPASAIRTASPASSTARTAPASASSSTGCRRISRSTRTAWPISTAPRSTSMPIRARASIPTGTPRSTISAGARWCRSWSTTRCSGPSNIMSTVCASMRSPRCSISTIRARPANGSPTSRAVAKISKRSASCRR